MLKQTPLHPIHKELGGKLIEFGGWEMPVQYSSIIEEHKAVRSTAGLFDISHMGEVEVSGRGAAAFLNYILTNDIRRLSPGWGQYSLMCNEEGGTIDDLYVYQTGTSDYLMIVNASRIEADVAWIERLHGAFEQRADVRVRDVSSVTGAIAVQGPGVMRFVDSVFSGDGDAKAPTTLKKNQIARFRLKNIECWVSRTGYTGEDGFEVVASNPDIVQVWNEIMKAGAPFGLVPVGLGARDTLRTEVCYPLYGHELDEEHGPVEAGLGFFVGWDKGDFVGRDALLRKKNAGALEKLVAFKTVEKSAPPRPGYSVWIESSGGEQVGRVVSGTLSPSLGVGIGMAYVKPELAKVDSTLFMEARGRRAPIVACKKPLYRKPVDPLPRGD